MNILMISDVCFPRVNGVSTSIMIYFRALKEKGHRVTVIAPKYASKTDDEIDIIRIPSRHLLIENEDRMMKAMKIYRLNDELAKKDFDIIHIQTPFVAHYVGVSLAKRLRLPRVESYHTFFEEYLHHYVPCVPKVLLKFVARHFSTAQCNDVDAIIVPSMSMLDILRRYGVHKPAEIIPTGINLSKFNGGDGERFRIKYDIPEDRPILVNVGRVAHEKNMDFLIKVVAKVRQVIPDVLLIIAGEGPAVKSLKKLIAMLNLQGNVMFVGYLLREKALLDCYRAGDVFIFASRTETQGLVLLEAMALGVPVVSTAVMGTKDILQKKMGALIAEEDIDDFADKVITILKDPKLRESLSHQAQQNAKNWNEERLTMALISFYECVIRSWHNDKNNASPDEPSMIF